MKTRHATRAAADWPTGVPDWIAALARVCDERGAEAAASLIGYSRTAVSLVIGNRYDRDMGSIERAVRAEIMAARVLCPVLGEIFDTRCLDQQARPLSTASRRDVALYQACRAGCEFSRLGEGS